MKIPGSVRIGGVEYRVQQEQVILLDGVECYGRINYAECEIKIRDRDIDQQYKAITLWHEILHGIASGSTVEIADEEEVVEMFARGIYQVLQDNGRRFFDLKEAEQAGQFQGIGNRETW